MVEKELIDQVEEFEVEEIETAMEEKEVELSDKELEKWFADGANDEEYINSKIGLVKRIKILLMFWHQLSTEVARAKEGYSLAKKWKDEDLKKKYMEEGRPVVKKMIVLEDELKTVLPEMKNISFLPQEELIVLPKWMLKLMGIKIDFNEIIKGEE